MRDGNARLIALRFACVLGLIAAVAGGWLLLRPSPQELVESLLSMEPERVWAGHQGLVARGSSVVECLEKSIAKEPVGRKRSFLIDVLSDIGPDAVHAGPMLAGVLEKDPSEPARASAARALGRIGSDSPTAKSALIHSLGDQEWQVRMWAAQSLLRIWPKYELPAAIQKEKEHFDSISVVD